VRTVAVTGSGSVSAVPDAAVLRVVAVHRAGSLSEALAGAESARAALVAAARVDVPDLLVGSSDLHVWPAHDHHGEPEGFEARHSLALACPSVASAGEVLTRLAAEVGDRLQVEGVSLVVSDSSAMQVEARELAMAHARAVAEHLAGLAGETLGRVQHVTDGAPVPTGPPGFRTASARSDVSLEPGESTVSASVSVVWELA
jgi:uncharacterized protein YggE